MPVRARARARASSFGRDRIGTIIGVSGYPPPGVAAHRFREVRVGTPPTPQVSLSGTNWLIFFGLQGMLAFNPLILNGLRRKYRKTKELVCGKRVEIES